MENLLPQASAKDIGFVLYKRRWSIFLILLATVAGTLGWLLFIRGDVYAVSTRILVKIGREQAPPPSVLGSSPLVVGYRIAEVNSEMEIFQSSEVMSRVIDRMNLDERSEPAPIPEKLIPRIKYRVNAAVEQIKEFQNNVLISVGLRERLTQRERIRQVLQGGLTVQAAEESNVFVAVLGTPYREGGSKVLNAILDEYLVYRQSLYSNDEFDFFTSVVDESLMELQLAESDLQSFETTEGISLLANQEDSLIQQIAAQRSTINDLTAARDESLFKLQQLEQELQKPEPNFGMLGDFPGESFQQKILGELADLQRERERLRLTEYDTGEKIQNNRNQFQTLYSMLAANLRSILAERQRQLETRRVFIDELDMDLAALHARNQVWTGLKRRVADLEGTYLTYRKKLTETKAATDMQQQQISNVVIIERAIDPIEPVGVRKTTLLGMAFLVGLFCALAWASILEFFDHKVYTQEHMQEQLGVPVLAVLSGERR